MEPACERRGSVGGFGGGCGVDDTEVAEHLRVCFRAVVGTEEVVSRWVENHL